MRRHAQCVRDGSNLIYYLELARFVREARWNYFIIKYLKTSVTACLPPLSRSACLLLENLKNLYWTWAIFYMQHNSPDFSTCKTSAAPDKLTPREENFLVLSKLCLVSETTIKISKVIYKQRADFITGRNSNCMNKKFPTNNWKPCCELSADDFFLGYSRGLSLFWFKKIYSIRQFVLLYCKVPKKICRNLILWYYVRLTDWRLCNSKRNIRIFHWMQLCGGKNCTELIILNSSGRTGGKMHQVIACKIDCGPQKWVVCQRIMHF